MNKDDDAAQSDGLPIFRQPDCADSDAVRDGLLLMKYFATIGSSSDRSKVIELARQLSQGGI